MHKTLKTVNQVSKIYGVSVRTLHHYDDIGLLKPTQVSEKGYRLYDADSLEKLQTILLFKELRFPLKEIEKIVNNPNFDKKLALKDQLNLLCMERERLDNIIRYTEEILQTGEYNMAFKGFDREKMEQYAAEVKQRWGGTDAYSQYTAKTSGRSAEKQGELGNQLMSIFADIGKLTDLAPESEEVQAQVKKLQDFITANYYDCTKQILAGLGSMYIADRRFKENIDKAGGEGAAAFVSKAIEIYCKE